MGNGLCSNSHHSSQIDISFEIEKTKEAAKVECFTFRREYNAVNSACQTHYVRVSCASLQRSFFVNRIPTHTCDTPHVCNANGFMHFWVLWCFVQFCFRCASGETKRCTSGVPMWRRCIAFKWTICLSGTSRAKVRGLGSDRGWSTSSNTWPRWYLTAFVQRDGLQLILFAQCPF